MNQSWLTIGRVRSVQTGSREVRVVPQVGYEYVFADMTWIRFQQGGGESLRCKVMRTRNDGTTAIVALSPGVSRDLVGELRGATVVAAREELPEKPEAAQNVREWIGYTVLLPSEVLLGTVSEVYEGPANDAFAVKRPDGGQSILPVIDKVIMAVDTEAHTIRVGDIIPYVVED